MNIRQLDWNQYHGYIDKLAKKIISKTSKTENQYRYIAGVDSDDMIVAVLLSHKLSIPVVTDINLLSLLIGFASNSEQVLIASNIVETGKSFQNMMNQLGLDFDTAVLFKDRGSIFNPTYVVEIPDFHVYFPWQKCGV